MNHIEIDKRAYGSITNFSRVIYRNGILNKEDLPEKEDIISLNYKNKFVAKAIYIPKSPIIKILTLKNEEMDKKFFYDRIKKANDYRTNILNYKDTYRMIYAEADYLPTIILDKYNEIASMQVSSKVMERYLDLIFECLSEITDIETLYVQRGKKGDKIKSRIYGNKNKMETTIEEGKAKFKVNLKGHKTGFFLDQRENRIDLENYIKEGDRVLDICCYTGGFSVHCGIKGAKVVGVDLSDKAIEVAKENMELNNLKDYEFIVGNAFDVMKGMIKKGEQFDVVILDPPAFTKTSKDIKNALSAYNTLNYLGLKLAKRMLVTCSCSFHVDREKFKNTVVSSAFRAKKEIRQIGPYRTQAPDHIITMVNKDLEYLKCLFFSVC
ncbi:MAG: rRNA (cytosine1962-C5)-methyltransferase [Methanothermococcus sp.]|jgi:23S rRNA (cytosine1962-C5)-methyltransferase|uniref:class I SAM-dependent rRNA methyltransferase n=1 Tax=Methanothermococcus TaxID=155862 RepID=UPI00037EABA9|nr:MULTISPECIES: class I SAM-dependent rRNA methyltransferase [Methanothermococcus]MDK2789888.1 rRNA (cytosine1962-C5)-methyltransferase [Methanothermococcus sp.]